MNRNPDNISYTLVQGTPYHYDSRLNTELTALRQRVNVFRSLVGTLSPETLNQLQEYFRLKNIYNSNAIEGNSLSMEETQLVIQEGLTISGKPLKDTTEVKNLDHALTFFEELANRKGEPITLQDLRNIHSLILRGIDDRNAGKYRSVMVKISGSEYRPPEPAKVHSEMREFGAWLEEVSQVDNEQYLSEDPIVLACAVHAWFVYIHPFIDGNGRTARLLMNLLLIRYGYPLTIITKDDRQRYYDALETSQGGGDLTPFIRLVLESAAESIEVYEKAAQTQLDLQQFVGSLFREQENRIRNEYEVFEGAMRILKGSFRQVVALIEEQTGGTNTPEGVAFKDFGALEFEKYQSLRQYESAKRTWFFRLTFYHNAQNRTERYLFFFGFASHHLSGSLDGKEVSLHIAVETDPFYYERLSQLPESFAPNILELGYLPHEEKFVYLDANRQVHRARAEEIAQLFIQQAFKLFRA